MVFCWRSAGFSGRVASGSGGTVGLGLGAWDRRVFGWFKILWMDEILHHFEAWETIICWYLQENHHSRVS